MFVTFVNSTASLKTRNRTKILISTCEIVKLQSCEITILITFNGILLIRDFANETIFTCQTIQTNITMSTTFQWINFIFRVYNDLSFEFLLRLYAVQIDL